MPTLPSAVAEPLLLLPQMLQLLSVQECTWSSCVMQVDNANLQQDYQGKCSEVEKLQHQRQASEQLMDSIEHELSSIKQSLQLTQSQAARQTEQCKVTPEPPN